MQSKGAKIGFIVLLVVFGLGAYWFYNYGPFAAMNNEAKKAYLNYIKTEATIISKESNGRVGKGASTIWTLQFKNNADSLKTATMMQSSFAGKNDGEKVIIYYDPTNNNVIVSEEMYNEVMN